MNKKGFTLVEILAVIVILGIVSTIGIVAISRNISKSKDASVVDLAKNYAESTRAMRAEETLYYEPKDGEVLIIPYSQVDGIDVEHDAVTAYGDIIPSYCFVGVVNKNNNFYYYINQVDESYHILDRVEYNSLSKNDIIIGAEELTSNSVIELKAPLSGFHIEYGGTTYNIKAARVKFSAVGGGKNVTLYGYFTTDSTYVKGTANIKGQLNMYDTFVSTGKFPTTNNNIVTLNGVNYTVGSSEILYIIAKK